MNRSLYSLILMDSVVEEVDKLAHRAGMNRSAFINQVLADYVSVTTPEQRIRTILSQMESLLSPKQFVPSPPQSPLTLALKSSLAYKYRPSLRYEVQLYRLQKESAIGELSVSFRTQSRSLLEAITAFCRLWMQWNTRYLSPLCDSPIRYTLTDLHFVQTLIIPREQDPTPKEIGEAISRFVHCFDSLLKAMLCGESVQNAEATYRACLAEIGLLA